MMNFLSHYYFERYTDNPYIVLGMVLPDLIKNADKSWNLNPQKKAHLFHESPAEMGLLLGWKRHLEVDRLFHNSDYFIKETAKLKKFILPALAGSPVKPFFLAHIGLELLLDQHLLQLEEIRVDRFYAQLAAANTIDLEIFLLKAGIPDPLLFRNFYGKFISSRYLFSYQETKNVAYALQQICKRLWVNPFSALQAERLLQGLERYQAESLHDPLVIFREIQDLLPDPDEGPIFSV